jgi:hypothetical protein
VPAVRNHGPTRPLSFLLTLVLAAACGSSTESSTPASDASTGTGSDLGAVALLCDPVKQDCPKPGDSCEQFCSASMARFDCFTPPGPRGSAQHGETCTGTLDCAIGLTCANTGGPQNHCIKRCRTDRDCPSGKTCPTVTTIGCGGANFTLDVSFCSQ